MCLNSAFIYVTVTLHGFKSCVVLTQQQLFDDLEFCWNFVSSLFFSILHDNTDLLLVFCI